MAAPSGEPRIDARPPRERRVYLDILRRLTPEQRLRKAFELSDMARRLFEQGLRQRHPGLSPEEFQRLLLARLDKCHNRNY